MVLQASFTSCKFAGNVCSFLFSGGRAGILEEIGMTHEDLVQPHVVVMQYSSGTGEGSQAPHSFQEVTSECNTTFCVASFHSPKEF